VACPLSPRHFHITASAMAALTPSRPLRLLELGVSSLREPAGWQLVLL